MFAVLPNDRERLAPVSLTREKPVAQFVIDRALALAAFFQPGGDFLFRLGARQAVDDRRINGDAFAGESNAGSSPVG
jgi:hypothetical protein